MFKPVSFRSWSTCVVADLPLFLVPCFGSQSTGSFITSPFLFQQCPINRSLLIFSVSVILGRLPYSSLLVSCSFQETSRTALRSNHSVCYSYFESSSSILDHKAVHLWPERTPLWDGLVGLISTLSSFCCVHFKLVQFLYSCLFHWIASTNQDIWSYILASVCSLPVWQDLLQVDCTACVPFENVPVFSILMQR